MSSTTKADGVPCSDSYEWTETRDDVKANRHLLCMPGYAAVPGVHTIELFHRNLPCPIGVVWYCFSGRRDTIEIHNSYVMASLRRCGARSAIHRAMLSFFPTITHLITQAGTTEGEAWMAATGYVRGPHGWEFTRAG